MEIAICDDSSIDTEALVRTCEETGVGEHNKYHTYTSGKALLNSIDDGKYYDIVFLDVDMPGFDGITTGKLLRQQNRDVIIIFVTSHPEFAIDAFECEAFHYLLKPCETSKLREVLSRAYTRLGLINQYIMVKSKDQRVKLPISDIYYVESLNRHIIYHMKDDDVSTGEKLCDVVKTLTNLGFCRVHQGFIVNLEKIRSFGRDSVTLVDGRQVMMSQRKKKDVSLEYAKYVEKFKR